MDALVGYGSDSSSSSSEAPPPPVAKEPEATKDADAPPKKKSRWGAPIEKDLGSLPPPRLSNQSVVEWETDFLSRHPAQHTPAAMNDDSRAFLQGRLELTSGKIDTGTTKALGKQLKEDHDFHNPRYLEISAAACGISDQLGSNLQTQEPFEDYEFNLLAWEEDARNKVYAQIEQQHAQNQQQQQQASQYATSHLERAMQQQCRR